MRWRIPGVAALVLATTAASFVAIVPASDLAPTSSGKPRVAFVCMNGVSMSVWAAATFNRLAERRGLPDRAFARATTHNYAAVPLRMKFALALEGYRIGSYKPEIITTSEADSAARVILIETELPSGSETTAPTEQWDGFVPMRERYFEGRRALAKRVRELVERMASDAGRTSSALVEKTSSASKHGSEDRPLFPYLSVLF